MYFTSFGGSTLLHVLAGHPRLIAVLGIASAVTVLSSPLGPGAHLGTNAYASRVERAYAAKAGISESAYRSVEQSVDRLMTTQDPNLAKMIAAALDKCGTNCSDLGVAAVMANRTLERDVLMIYALDRLTTAAGTPVARATPPQP
jgi:hypothetical protein